MTSSHPTIIFEEFNEYDKHFKKINLGDVTEIKTGPFGSTLHAKDYVNSGIPIITTEHFKSGSLPYDKEGLPQVSDIDYKRLKSYILRIGDIVFSRVGSVDINALVTPKQDAWLFSGRVLRVRPSEMIESNYLHYLLDTTVVKQNILSRAVGQTMPSINTQILKNTKLQIVSSFKNQSKIGKFFLEIDKNISLHHHELALLKQRKKAFLQKMFPKKGCLYPEIRLVEYGDVWRKEKFGDLGDTFTGLSGKTKEDFGHGEAEFITYKNVFNNYLAKETLTENVEIDQKQNQVMYGDILFTTSSETPEEVGMSSVWLYDKKNVYLNSFCFGFRLNKDLNPLFLAYYLRSPEVRKKFMVLAQGISRYNISKTKVLQMIVKIPNIDEQQKIGQFFKQLDDGIALHEQKLEKLKEMKKAFLQKMFV